MSSDNAYSLGLYEKAMPGSLTLPQKLMAAKRAGYDFMELSIDESDEKLERLDWSAQQRTELLEAMRQAELPIKSICLSGHRRFPLGDPAPDIQRRGLEIMRKAVTLAAQLGVRVIQIAGYDVYYKASSPHTRAIFAANLTAAVDMAAREGVILGFETMETPFLDTVEKAMAWVGQINSPYLQIYPDIGNLTNAEKLYGANVAQDMKKGEGHIVALHLKETKPGHYREIPYGSGHVDFGAAAACAWAQGVRLYTGEFWHLGEADWENTLAENGRFLRGWLDSAARVSL